mgnify:CR=1 FL=1
MIQTSHPSSSPDDKLLNYLRQKLRLSESAIEMGLKHSHIEQAPLPIVLWSFGLLNLSQYQQVLDWQDQNFKSDQ